MEKKQSKKLKNDKHIRIQKVRVLHMLESITKYSNISENQLINDALEIGLEMIAENIDKKGENYEPRLAKKIDEIKEQIKVQNDKFTLDDELHSLHNEILMNLKLSSACYNVVNRLLENSNLEKINFMEQSKYDNEVSDFIKQVHNYEIDLADSENDSE